MVLGQVDAGRLDVTPTMRDRLEAAAVALEVLRDEPAPVDLDRLTDRPCSHDQRDGSDTGSGATGPATRASGRDRVRRAARRPAYRHRVDGAIAALEAVLELPPALRHDVLPDRPASEP